MFVCVLTSCVFLLFNCLYYLCFLVPSSISNLLVNNSVQEGRNATYFIATETGNNLNLPVLSWYYNGTLLNDNSQQLDVFQDRVGVSTLKIRASMSGNSGLYSVRGQNVVNTVESLAELRVVDSGKHLQYCCYPMFDDF